MDTIGSSTKLMWFFVCIYSYPILLLIFSVAIWSYNRFKRLAFISYITGTILTVFILLIDINNLVAKFIKGNFMYNSYLWNLFFAILSVIFIIISIGFRQKSKKITQTSHTNKVWLTLKIQYFSQLKRHKYVPLV